MTATEVADATGTQVELSVVVPFFQEEQAASDLVRELREVLVGMGRPFQLILVDDGSSDATFERLKEGASGEERCTVLRLARNYGQTAALAAGIDRAEGEVIVTLDGDGQNDPKDIPLLLSSLTGDHDVVSGWRRGRKDKLFTRRIPSWIANRMVAFLSGVRLHDFGCSLKAYRRRYLQGIRLYGEMHRFLVIHSAWQGARVAEVEVNHRPRTQGASKYGLERTYKVILDLLVMVFLKKYSTKPIYVFGGFGMLSFLAGFLCGVASVAYKLSPVPRDDAFFGQKDFVETPLPLLMVMLCLVGVLSVLMGLLAEMLTRTYHESQAKPVYSLAESVSGAESEEDD